ncbi:toxin, partial [Streptococcus pyogenes]
MSMNRYIYDKVNRLIKKYKTRDPIELIEALNINLVYLPETKILLGMYHYIQ